MCINIEHRLNNHTIYYLYFDTVYRMKFVQRQITYTHIVTYNRYPSHGCRIRVKEGRGYTDSVRNIRFLASFSFFHVSHTRAHMLIRVYKRLTRRTKFMSVCSG